MNYVYAKMAVCLSVALFCVKAFPQGSFVLTDANTQTAHTFTNTAGTAVLNNGMIVFEGELKSDMVVVKDESAATGFDLASVRLLAQVRLFDELPASGDVGTAQGAIAALRDSPSATTGKYFVWGITNSAPLAWVPLMMTNNTQFAVNDGATNFITFVFHYPETAGDVTYQVFVGSATATVMEPSDSVVSPTALRSGITGVSLLGVGGLTQVASASGAPGPLSTQVGFSVYDTASGIFMVIDTVNESGRLPIKVYAWINGAWQLVGEVPASQVHGDGLGHRYEIYALPGSGLALGQSYKFQIVDESGNTHTYGSGLTITGTKMQSVVFELNTMIISFNSEVNHDYLVKVADSPNAPAEQWTVQYVSQNVGGVWADYSNEPFTAGAITTSIKIPISSDKKKAFFKVFKMN